jgi:FemAB-related protein (PEP-CTERM system-associated)
MVAINTIAGDPIVDRQTVHRFVAPVHVAVASDRDGLPWDDYVGSQDAATGYHAWAWRRVFERAFGHERVYLMARRNDRVCGVLPLVFVDSLLFGRMLVSLPFVNYGGILADDGQAVAALVEASADIARSRRCRSVELRHIARLVNTVPCKQHKVTMHLELSRAGWDQLDKKVRNQIRKAEKSGLTSALGGAELLPEFYQVFARNMRDLGTPVYGRKFFVEMLREFAPRMQVHVVRLGNLPVAAGLTFRMRSTLEIPWASSIRDFNTLCPNHLLYWNVLQYAKDTGCELFDFGRSTPGGGPYKFKEQWGARPVPLHWEYAYLSEQGMPDVNASSPRFERVVAMWQRLPLAMANRLGPLVVRGIP